MPSDELALTQELVASMIGVRRESITDAAMILQRDGLIKCRRGHITILDRHGMEDQACECYSVVKMEFDRLLGLDWDWRPMPESASTWSKASTGICAQM
jgi:Mn-dependent DtxR family transcriptional regulator